MGCNVDSEYFKVGDIDISSQRLPSFDILQDGRVVVSWGDLTGAIQAAIYDPREVGAAINGTGLNDVYIGSSFNDTITLGAGNDTVEASSGNDTIFGGPGNDQLDAGSGVNMINGDGGYDRAVYNVAANTVLITNNANGTKTIEGFGFRDTLTGVEVAQFAGGQLVSLVERTTNRSDLLADGRSDVLLRNAADGSVYVWNVNGTALTSSGYVGWTPGAVWKARGTGDFNGDGRSDILLQNVNSGQCFTFMVDGTAAINTGLIGFPSGADWPVRGTGDFNGDGQSDILFQHIDSGLSYVWLLDGTAVTAFGQVGWVPGAQWEAFV